ncbi:MAG TPA: DUF885 domain-containing protein [Actinomycetota bacterium]|nr:DUF885 domain-containing protein [Actinomycetota bacterium]
MSQGTDEGAVRELADRYWDQLLELEPLLATQVGDERFVDRLPDPSDEGVARRREVHEEALRAAAAIGGRERLDPVLRTTLDVLEAIARRELADIAHRLDRLRAVSHLWGPAQLLAELGSLQRADTPERLARYLARLRAVPAYLEASARVAPDGLREGRIAPRLVVERATAQVERLLSLPPEDSPAVQPVPEADAEGRSRVVEVLREDVLPGYEAYLATLREYLPRARESIGLSALPDGDAMYASQILAWTTLPLDAREVHELGVSELEKIQEERRAVAAALGYGSPAEAIAHHQTSGANTAGSREELLRLAEDQVRRGWEAAPALFGRLPRANCEVRLVEGFREADMPFAFYQPPSEDGGRPGIYYVNAYDLRARPLHHLATTTFHEANPGHHLQLSLEQELRDRPALRRFGSALAGSSFVEGWGLYAERLADEMGLFVDAWERLGMLDAQAHRAARLVVDTGIHALGWPRERAVAVLREAGVPEVDAEIETDRYVAMPAQALAYTVGMLEIQRLRAEAAAREGSGFSLRAFHDRLLALGSLPLPALRRELGG